MIGRDAVDKLCRAVSPEEADGPRAALTKILGAAIFDQMPPEQALLLERWLGQVAAAAEELGPDAAPEAIMARARELAAQPT